MAVGPLRQERRSIPLLILDRLNSGYCLFWGHVEADADEAGWQVCGEGEKVWQVFGVPVRELLKSWKGSRLCCRRWDGLGLFNCDGGVLVQEAGESKT